MELLFKLLLASQISSAPAPVAPVVEVRSDSKVEQAYFKGIVLESEDRNLSFKDTGLVSYQIALK